MSDQQRIDQIAARMAQITPGPWVNEGDRVVLRDGPHNAQVAVAGWHDAKFIANAPEDIAWLMSKITV